MSAIDDIIQSNREFCRSNLFVVYNGAIPVNCRSRTKWGHDYTRLDLEFRALQGKGRKFHISIFDPDNSAEERRIQSIMFHSLCETLGTDFDLIPPCPGGFEEFVEELSSEALGKDGQPLGLLNRFKDKKLFIKLTMNEKGYFRFGTGRCTSNDPDLIYSEEDLRFLAEQEESLSTLDDDTNFMQPF